jgi:hypothetical protein
VSIPRRFTLPVLAGAALVVLAAALAGAEPARAIDPSPFILGTGIEAPNVSTAVTALTGSGGVSLDIENVSPSATAIYGVASATTGVTTGIYGKTNSTGPGSAGLNGVLNTGLPGAGAAGVIGSSFSTTDKGPGVYGLHLSSVGTGPGVLGETNSGTDFAAGLMGVVGASSAGSGSAGIRGINHGTGPTGVGIFGSQAGSGWGLYGTTTTGAGSVGFHTGTTGALPGMWGETFSDADGAMGVLGRVHSTSAGAASVGVRGINDSTGPAGVGVFGSQNGSGWGVYGQSPRGNGVVGASTTGYAGYFFGNVRITGSVGQSAGANVIDDPTDPAKAYLRQAYVGSPDMKNIYDGVATTDAKGYAVVKLPAYFQSLNKDYRYQLTSLSGLQQVAVAKEIAHNRFTIQSEQPRSRVSWQVTGIRKDRFASAHRIQPVQQKAKAEQGKYLDPQLYGQPRSKAIGANDQLGAPPPAPVAKAVKVR